MECEGELKFHPALGKVLRATDIGTSRDDESLRPTLELCGVLQPTLELCGVMC